MSKSPITCHILDSSIGKPASGVKVSVELISLKSPSNPGDLPKSLASGETDGDGRCTTLLDPCSKLSEGVYKLVFHTGEYFEGKGVQTLYPVVEITFNYADPTQHYHIPLLVSPWSYTTYRGS